jgi:hypothetical protein
MQRFPVTAEAVMVAANVSDIRKRSTANTAERAAAMQVANIRGSGWGKATGIRCCGVKSSWQLSRALLLVHLVGLQ